MNKCSNCGHEFEGKFCPECGTKFVDKDVCPKCGAKHAPDAKFCTECGARLDGKLVCSKCGAQLDGNAAFCIECGAKIGQNAPREKGAAVTRDKVKSIMYLAGIVCILLSALMGLVFAFVCGVSIKSDGKIAETSMLYDYFGNAYKDLDSIKVSILEKFNWRKMGEAREFALYFPVVLGTAISAVGLLGVVALSALTGYKAYKKFYKKQEANVFAPAIATYLTFATLATLLLALTSADAADNKTVFSTPTLAGLIVGGVFCGLGAILVAASHIDEFKGVNATVGSIISVSVCALTVVVIALLALPAGGAKITGYINIEYGYPQLISTKSLSGLFTGMQSSLLTVAKDETMFKIVPYCTVGGVAAVALAVISAVTLFRKVPAVCKGENKSNIVLCAVAVALAAIYLAFTVLFVDLQYEESTAEITKVFAAPITILIMTVVAFGAELGGKIFAKVKSK